VGHRALQEADAEARPAEGQHAGLVRPRDAGPPARANLDGDREADPGRPRRPDRELRALPLARAAGLPQPLHPRPDRAPLGHDATLPLWNSSRAPSMWARSPTRPPVR